MSYRQDKRFIIAIVLVAIIAVGGTYAVMSSSMTGKTSAATSVATSAASMKGGGTIVDEEPCCIDSLDPAVAWTQGLEITFNVYQQLMQFGSVNGVLNASQIIPFLAENYNVSSDGLTYTFQIRHNVTFSNGDPLNSYVFWYSMYRLAVMSQSPAYMLTVAVNTTSVTASILNQYTNATPPASLIQIMQNPTNAIVAPNQYELVFHLEQPFAAFIATLAESNGAAVDPVVVSAHGGVVAGQTNSWMSMNMVGTGPFELAQYQPNAQLVLAKNPTYWGGVDNVQPTPSVDRIIIKYVPDALTRVEDVQRGGAQMAYVDPSLVAQAVSAGGIYVPNIGVNPTFTYWSLNTQRFPLNNRLIRQAVVHAINYTAILPLYHGFATPMVGPTPIGVLGYDPDLKPYSYNLTLARQLLAQAGYPNGQGIPVLQMLAPTDSPPCSDIAVVIQSNLADIGIQVKVVTEPSSTMDSLMSNTSPTSSAYPDILGGVWGWFPDPWAFANWIVGPLGDGVGGNMGYYNNTRVNDLLNQATGTLDPSQRAAIYQQIAQIAYGDAPIIWTGQAKNSIGFGIPIVNTSVGGYIQAYGAGTDFSHLYLTS
jgi:peptide/nickel transport system substrate-binding protein